MPLSDGYGVLVGTVANYYPDNPDNAGRYYHVNLELTAPAGSYRCAIDVDSHENAIGVEWRVVPLLDGEVAALSGLTPGWHPLESTSTSGAVDYVRSPMFQLRLGCAAFFAALLRRSFSVASTWKRGTSAQAVADFGPLATITKNAGLRALVYGEPFTRGLGLHNIHQNQGDPLSSRFAGENGIWQDGLTVLQQSATTYIAFMNKFTSQSYATDDRGRPA